MLKQVQHDYFVTLNVPSVTLNVPSVTLNLFQGLCLKEKEVRVKKRDAETSSARQKAAGVEVSKGFQKKNYKISKCLQKKEEKLERKRSVLSISDMFPLTNLLGSRVSYTYGD